jgi:hypothetical protein
MMANSAIRMMTQMQSCSIQPDEKHMVCLLARPEGGAGRITL